jgi:hypothetical protein
MNTFAQHKTGRTPAEFCADMRTNKFKPIPARRGIELLGAHWMHGQNVSARVRRDANRWNDRQQMQLSN